MRTWTAWLLALSLGVASCGAPSGAQNGAPAAAAPGAENVLTDAERAAGFALLFDGASFAGWEGLGRASIPPAHWIIEDGTIHKVASGDVPTASDGQPLEGGDIMTTETYSDFELVFEWRVAPGANSGIKFITDAPWSADGVWRCLRAVLPEREGLVIFAGTSFPKPGTSSVGVARQYCGAVGKVANGQVAVTAALWTGLRAYLLGAALYVPEAWLTDAARDRARLPRGVRLQAKWRQALTLLRQVRASGLTGTGVLADAEFGDTGLFRAMWHRLRLPYAVGISSSQTVFLGRPRLGHRRGGRLGRPRTRPDLAAGVRAYTVAQAAKAQPRWRPISWRNRRGGRRWTVQCVALRVTPAHDWRDRRLAPEVWLLAERDTGATPRTKYFFVNLPATTSWPQLVRLAHQRWAIEQQYQELKPHLGLDHFEGRTFPGWHHHVVLTAVTYNFLQAERRRHLAGLTFPVARAIVQEIFTADLFAPRPFYLNRIEALKSVQLRI